MKYYEINEETARLANNAFSFRDYKPGSATAEYRASVDYAAELVEQQKKQVSPYYHEKLDTLLDRYSRRLAEWTNAMNRNTASCPSIAIAGGSNFPVNKKRKQNAREDSLMREYNEEIKPILDKIKAVGTGGVDLADPNAREILEERLGALKKEQGDGKAMNAHFRKCQTMKGFPGMSDEEAEKMDKEINGSYTWLRKPCPDYRLANLRDKIKRTEERIAELDRRDAAKDESTDEEVDGVRIVRDLEQDRLQLIFDGKPDDDIRTALKSNGFRWSPRNQAWQRQLTDNAERAARRVLCAISAAASSAADDVTMGTVNT